MSDNIKVNALANYKVKVDYEKQIDINLKLVSRLPTLIKAYLKFNATIGEGAVVDNKFKTTDVFVFLPIEEINLTLLLPVVKGSRTNFRNNTASVKTRAQVSGTGAKPWAQKGTGRARQVSLRSPQFIGGGLGSIDIKFLIIWVSKLNWNMELNFAIFHICFDINIINNGANTLNHSSYLYYMSKK